jgi:hypothetical protein
MRKPIFLAAVLALSAAFPKPGEAADAYFPKALIDDQKQIEFSEAEATEKLSMDFPGEIFVFKDAAVSCDLDLERVTFKIQEALKPDGLAVGAISRLVDAPLAQIGPLHLKIFISDFGKSRAIYRSLYLPEVPGVGAAIFVDCSLAAQLLWTSTLAHELTHAILNKSQLESWFEEGLAQSVEVAAGGAQPFVSAGLLQAAGELPALRDLRRPLPTGAPYGMSFLFARYLLTRFGGWATLSAMIQPDGPCGSEGTFETTVCRARNYLTAKLQRPDLAEIMTPAGILRYFAVAVSLDTPYYSLYQIPGWMGLDADKHYAPVKSLLPGSFAKMDYKDFEAARLDESESYRIISWGNQFRIFNPPFADARSSLSEIAGLPESQIQDFVLRVRYE